MPSQFFAQHRLLHRGLIVLLTIAMLVGPGPWGASQAYATTGQEEEGESDEPTVGEECEPCSPGETAEPAKDTSAAETTCDPIHIRRGSALENETDLSIPGPAFSWAYSRSYDSGDVSSTTGRNQFWVTGSDTPRLVVGLSSTSVHLMVTATNKRTFRGSSSPLLAPADYNAKLTYQDTVDSSDLDDDLDAGESFRIYMLTEQDSGTVFRFFGHSSNIPASHRGRLIERTTRDYQAAGLKGILYRYNAQGDVSYVTTAQPQQWYIGYNYTYVGGAYQVSEISVKAGGSGATEIMRADYTYFATGTHDADVGTVGDLVQVKVSLRDSAMSNWIERTTQYRYYTNSSSEGRAHQLKFVLGPDAVQRAIDAGLTDQNSDSTIDARDLLYLADSDAIDTASVNAYASRTFTYYTAPLATDNSGMVKCETPWSESVGENLNGAYGGTERTEFNSTQNYGSVKTETVGDCPSCGGGTSGIRRTYFYMDKNGGTSTDPNVVVKIVVEDSEDVNQTPVSRRVWGLNFRGVALREAFIENPTLGTLKAWCTSKKLNSDLRITEERMASAHTVVNTTAAIEEFLNPTGGSGSNDTDTVNPSSGVVYYYEYDGTYGDGKYRTGTRVGKGAVGVGNAHYISATDWGDATSNVDDEQPYLPVAQYVYPAQATTRDGGDRIRVAQYIYDFWDAGDTSVQKVTIRAPIVTSDQNGPDGTDGTDNITTEQCFDKLGRLRWTKDGDGYVNYLSYHPTNGRIAYVATDVPNSYAPASNSAWAPVDAGDADTIQPSRGVSTTALNLISKTEYDDLGRVSKQIEPGGGEHVTRYFTNGTARFPYVVGTAATLPVQVTLTNKGGVVLRTFGVKPSAFETDDTSIIDSSPYYATLTYYLYNPVNGQLSSIENYWNALYADAYQTTFLYDAQGRRGATIQEVEDGGPYQVTAQLYDVRGRVVESRRGVATTEPTNYDDLDNALTGSEAGFEGWAKVAETVYDGGNVGDSRVTSSKLYYGTGGSQYIESIPKYTFRGHVRGVDRTNGGTPFGPYQVRDVDWMGRTVASATYEHGTTIVWPTDYATAYVNSSTNSTTRHDITRTYYDKLGRVYRTDRFPGKESVSHFEINNYYDGRGNLVATGDEHSAQQEYAYDGAGRQYQQRMVTQTSGAFGSGGYTYAAPIPNPTFDVLSSSGNGGIIELSHSEYETGTNRVSMSHVVEVNHDDEDGFSLTSGEPTGGVRQTTWNWYDIANRPIATAYHGAGDATDMWESTPLASGYLPGTPLNWNDAKVYNGEVLLTKYTYNANSGRQETVVRGVKANVPNTVTSTTKTFYDDLGRRTFVAENWGDFAPPSTNVGGGTNNDQDRVTGWTYNGLGQTVDLTAYNAGTTSQVTKYLYEDNYNAALVTNTIYPDSGNTNSGGTDQVKLAYNLDGSLNTRTDQRGVVMAYTYDNARRVTREGATTIPSGVDGFVKSISRTYDTLGRVTEVTSWENNNGSGTVRNELLYTYNTDGTLQQSQQDHAGDVTGGEPSVQYAYDSTAPSNVFTNGLRPTRVTYPTSDRKIYSTYGTDDAIDDRLSRTTTLANDNGSGALGAELVAYKYNGTNRMVDLDYTSIDVVYRMYNLSGAGTSIYNGWNQFGRLVRGEWWSYGSSAMRDEVAHAYDLAGNRLTRTNAASATVNQAYTYDGFQRLKTNDESTAGNDRYWELDQLGNWQKLRNGTTSDGTLLEERTHNTANEFTNFETPNTSVDPTYDAAGNMTQMPASAVGDDPSWPRGVKYDAWNRMVEIRATNNNRIQANEYDGLHRRIIKARYDKSNDALIDRRHYYYNENWQCLEERIELSGTINPNPVKQYVYHPHYIDALAVSYTDSNYDGSGIVEHFYCHDANFNVTGVLNNSGTVVERYAYTPYGKATVLLANFTADGDNISDIDNEFLYTGRRLDPETGLQYSRYQYYHPQLGRFVNRDPNGYQGGMNLYGYVGGMPTYYVDPSGLAMIWPASGGRPMPIAPPDPTPPLITPVPPTAIDPPHLPLPTWGDIGPPSLGSIITGGRVADPWKWSFDAEFKSMAKPPWEVISGSATHTFNDPIVGTRSMYMEAFFMFQCVNGEVEVNPFGSVVASNLTHSFFGDLSDQWSFGGDTITHKAMVTGTSVKTLHCPKGSKGEKKVYTFTVEYIMTWDLNFGSATDFVPNPAPIGPVQPKPNFGPIPGPVNEPKTVATTTITVTIDCCECNK